MLNKTLGEIAEGYTCLGDPKYKKETITKVSYDSRQVDGETLFVPIIGEHVNAHTFIPDMLEKTDCKGCFISEYVDYTGDKLLITCENTVEAVQNLAKKERSKINVPVIAVTGSVGKTTTREMIAAALRGGRKVFSTARNQNSQIGVAKTILEFDESADIAVLELGISLKNEMRPIAELALPETAVFTNIGVTHIENLGSRENILKEKMHVTDFMPEGSTVFLNHDNDLLRDCAIPQGLRRFDYGTTPDCDAYASDIDMSDGCPSFVCHIKDKTVPVKLGVYGEHQILNAVVALAVADYYGVDLNAAAENIEQFNGFSHRQQIIRQGSITVIDDSYNAAPDSVKTALNILSSFSSKSRRIAVLADMRELGEITESAHRDIGKYIKSLRNIDMVITYGDFVRFIDDETETIHFDEKSKMEEYINKMISDDDVILYKGSNTLKLFDSVDILLNNAKRC